MSNTNEFLEPAIKVAAEDVFNRFYGGTCDPKLTEMGEALALDYARTAVYSALRHIMQDERALNNMAFGAYQTVMEGLPGSQRMAVAVGLMLPESERSHPQEPS